MLVGLNNKTRQKVYAFQNVEYIKKLVKDKKIVCQECGEPLILKAGPIKTHHFAHDKCVCTYKYGEPETENHIRGKIEMQKHLKILFPNSKVEIEYKVEETNQRTDVMVIHPNGERWAFEIQCSRISVATLIERSKLYQSAGVIDSWFLSYDYSSYFSNSSMTKLSKSIQYVKPKLYKIYFDKSIGVEDTLGNNIFLKDVIFKKKDFYLSIIDINLYKISNKFYTVAIDSFYNHLKTTYPNSNVCMKYLLEGSNEKADIIIINERTSKKCAFNFIFPYINKKSIDRRANEYSKRTITVFWFYASLVGTTFNDNYNFLPGENSYFINYSNGKWSIIENDNVFLPSAFLLENLRIEYKPQTKDLVLKDGSERISQNKEILKRINWIKYRNIWSGSVYKCPRSSLEEHDLRIEDIKNCDKCKYFYGYIREGKKKIYVKCRGARVG